MIERDFDIPFIADLALREKQIQQSYRPIIAIHKWFARRPGTLFRGLILSEFVDSPLRESFYRSNNLAGRCIADPFMGGGTPLIEANRVGCDVIGFDLNPVAYWIVREQLERLDLGLYREAGEWLRQGLETQVGNLYRTECRLCGGDAPVKYFLWVKTKSCESCGGDVDLFPGYVLAYRGRHPRNVLVCPECGELTETDTPDDPGHCSTCSAVLTARGPASGGGCDCPHCGHRNSYGRGETSPPRHKMFAIEYFCPDCNPDHAGRSFKAPDAADLERYRQAEERWMQLASRFVPDDKIPAGKETDRLHRWGYGRYREMFNPRQLLGLELSCCLIAAEQDTRLRAALSTNLSDLLRYQNMLCRYDTTALKSLDIFSVHGYPVGLVQCESNLLGIQRGQRGGPIGSGGWLNITTKYETAKAYCEHPFEIVRNGSGKKTVYLEDEYIGDVAGGLFERPVRAFSLYCADSTAAVIPPNSLDAVFTDPPYFDNVQYAELMDFCFVWLRRLVGTDHPGFDRPSTRDDRELTGNARLGRCLGMFTEGISAVFCKMADALKPGGPLAFTYHHNTLGAYAPLVVAILDAGLVCTATIPCPAEMGASIHINGTGSSIIDTVFVCRHEAELSPEQDPEAVARRVDRDLEQLIAGSVKPTDGDIRCIVHGHLARLAIAALRDIWSTAAETEVRLERVTSWWREFGEAAAVLRHFEQAALVQKG